MAPPPDYYAILGVDRRADIREIKRAWRQAARDHHPDLPANQGGESQVRFKLVKEAYDVLADTEQRARYDQWWDAVHGGARDWRGSWDEGNTVRTRGAGDDLRTQTGASVADIFANLWGGTASEVPEEEQRTGGLWDPGRLGERDKPRGDQGTSGRAQPGDAARTPWPWDADRLAREAFGEGEDGAEPPNQGRGGPWRDPDDAAWVDRGDGTWGPRVRVRAGAPPSRGEDLRIPASVPFGLAARGGSHRLHVRVADPSGAWRVDAVDLPVPPGAATGFQVRVSGRGEFPLGPGPRGDLVVTLTVEEHPHFRRDGDDLLADLALLPSEAAAGCVVELPTLEGSVSVRVPAGVRSGQRIRLRDLGIVRADGGRGAQVLTVQVQVPPGLSPAQIDILRALEGGWSPRHER